MIIFTKDMIKQSLLLVFSIALLASCKGNKRTAILNTWHAVQLDNHSMDSALQSMQAFIDTVGKNTDAATNMEMYGATNIDSLKKILQVQLDSVNVMQDRALKETVFKFRKDSVAILSFSGNTDSMKWYFDTDTSITLNNLGGIGSMDQVRMEVISLSDTAMKLRFKENGTSSTVTFHPEGK